MNSTLRNRKNSANFLEIIFRQLLLVEIIFRIYKPNLIIVFDPLFSMIGIIFSECWADVNDAVKKFFQSTLKQGEFFHTLFDQ